MKNTIRCIVLLLFLIFASSFVFAQGHHHHSKYMPGWPISDSAQWGPFNCSMDDFNFNDFPFCKNKKRYNGHWAGVELGVSGYVTPGFNMNFNPEYPYLNMNTARSLTVNLNPFEINANLYKNHLGFTTGLGFQISNYYFTDNYVMLKDSAALVAYQVQDAYGNMVSIKINKMVVSYLNIPLLFEYQTNPFRRTSSFHITAGVIAGVRIGSYTKQVYPSKGETYYLIDNNGNRIASFENNHYVVRDRGAYHLAPFKLDAAFRIGWSHLNLFATYSITRMFQKDQGPELYPWTVGLTLLGW